MSTPYAAAETVDRPDESILELTDGENPLSILSMDEPDTALGVISWMDDHDRIEGWRRAEIESDGEPRKVILKALEKQKRALEADATLPIYHDRHRRSTTIVDAEPVAEPETPADPETTDATTDPVAATDGGQTVTDEPDADDVHPDVKGLVAGEVLVLEYADRTEYVFPATTDADAPYLMRAFDGDDERTAEPIGLTFDEVLSRIDSEEPRPLAEIDVQAPADAATNGGDPQ